MLRLLVLTLLLGLPSLAQTAPLVLNEYNATSGSKWLNGGDQDFDEDCTPETLPCEPPGLKGFPSWYGGGLAAAGRGGATLA